jgi:flavin reductase (DIM6/NTAB) family NADH-FMN oxidoreductase RutF
VSSAGFATGDPALEAAFREALARFASGVVVVMADTPEGPVGLTVSAFSSVSLDPPLVLVCIGKSASAFGGVTAAERFGISVLHERQTGLAEQFARKDIDRFAGVGLVKAAPVPWLDEALAHIACAPEAIHDAGDHVILVGRVFDARSRAGRPLVHYSRALGGFERPPVHGRAGPPDVEARRES